MIIIGIVDGLEYREEVHFEEKLVEDMSREIFYQRAHDNLISTMENIQEHYTTSLLTELFIMDYDSNRNKSWIPTSATCITSQTSITTGMCNILSKFLLQFSEYATKIRALPTIKTPLKSINNSQTPPIPSQRQFSANNKSKSERVFSFKDDNSDKGNFSSIPSITGDSPNMSIVDSPRPESPSILNDDPASPDLSADVSSAENLYKKKPRPVSMNTEKTSKSIIIHSAERDRNIGKARVGLIIGNLYLMAGIWNEAWKELLENTNKLKSLNDYIWVAIGVEKLLLCMILLGSEGFSFQVPNVCLLSMEKHGGLPLFEYGRDNALKIGHQETLAANASLIRLGSCVHEVSSTIISYVDKAGIIAGEYLLQRSFSELVLRLSLLQVFVQNNNESAYSPEEIFSPGKLDSLKRTSKDMPGLSNSSISQFVYRAFPETLYSDDSITDISLILINIISVLSLIKMDRKKAMIIKEYISLIIPSLQRARMLGAAEVGVHPLDNLMFVRQSSIEDQSPKINKIIGPMRNVYLPIENKPGDIDSFESMLDKVVRSASLDHIGNLNLKLDVLRKSISFCESIPDLEGVAMNAALLLRTAGPQKPIMISDMTKTVNLQHEEQVRLADQIVTAVMTCEEINIEIAKPHYWDDFLVRNIQLLRDNNAENFTQRKSSDLIANNNISTHKKSPKVDMMSNNNIVVVGESIWLAIVLQNPHAFDIRIEHMELITDDHRSVDIIQETAILGSTRLQEILCRVKFEQSGTIIINACKIRMAGCRDDIFAIYNNEWEYENVNKLKNIQITNEIDQIGRIPKTLQSKLQVIPEQPRLEVELTNVNDQSVTLFDGERKIIIVSLKNTSMTRNINYLKISLSDNYTQSLRDTIEGFDMARNASYDAEYELRHSPILQCKRVDEQNSETIPANSSATFELIMIGKTGLKTCSLNFEYGNTEGLESSNEQFYTRHHSINLNLTVQPSPEINQFDIISLPRLSMTNKNNRYDDEHYCKLFFELRNPMSNHVSIVLKYRNDDVGFIDGKMNIHSGQTERMELDIPRIYIDNSHDSIPTLSSQPRQTIVKSKSDQDVEYERFERVKFWYREYLLNRLEATWYDEHTGRHGNVNLRSALKLNQTTLNVLKLEDVDISTCIIYKDQDEKLDVTDLVSGEFYTLHVNLVNRSTGEISSIIRIQPILAHQSRIVLALELANRNILWSGTLQQSLAILKSRDATSFDLGFCILSPGVYKIGIIVEETMAEGNNSRRTWQCPEQCILNIKE